MSFTVQYAARVFDDLQNAYDYYIEKAVPEVAERFLNEIQNTMNSVIASPYAFSIRYRNVRCAVPKTFPFLIHFQISEETNVIRFIAVVNTYRRPLR